MVWIPFHQGLHVSNFPINVEEVAEYCFKRWGIDRKETRRRIIVIPDEDLERWMVDPEKGQGEPDGPWNWFEDNDVTLSGTHFALDECHLFVPQGVRDAIPRRKKWRDWCSMIRHEGCAVEFLTQTVSKFDKEVFDSCDLRINLISRLADRDPVFGVPMADWYELKSWLKGEWAPVVLQVEKRRGDKGFRDIDGGKKLIGLEKRFYKLYNSYNRPHGSQSEGHEEKHVFETKGLVGLLLWFWRRNWWPFTLRLSIPVVIFFVYITGVWRPMFVGGMMFVGYVAAFVSGDEGNAFDVLRDEPAVASVEAATVETGEPVLALVDEEEPYEVLELVDGMVADDQGNTFVDGLNTKFQLQDPIYRLETDDGFEFFTLADLEDHIYNAELERRRLQVAEGRLEVLENRDAGLVMLTRQNATFDNGEIVYVGDTMQGTQNAGAILTAIDYDRRRIMFDTGIIVYLRLSDGKKRSAIGAVSDGVRRGVSDVQASAGGDDASGARDSGRRGPSDRPVSPPNQ
tara:strand:- start:5560 stop:7101 length:1542 start_codon:yes stop_codon:yes gene_type:complete